MPPRKKKPLSLDSAQAWSDAFLDNHTLIHLDFSHNNFDSSELSIISQGLNENRTIYGLHIQGNEGTLDAKGFIIPEAHQDLAAGVRFTRIRDYQQGITKANGNCWICEGWTEHTFKYSPAKPIDITKTMVMLHPSCDDFEGIQMDIDEELSYEMCKKEIKKKSLREKMAFGLINYDPQNVKVFDK